ncbi:APA1 [Symbiodinium sp. CCMP2592]|nr:APA1 [Symbiodinium sp. CCMP2592]
MATAGNNPARSAAVGEEAEAEACKRRRNIQSSHVLSLLSGLMEQLLLGPVFTIYLFRLAAGAGKGPWFLPASNPNSSVGVLVGLNGMVKLLIAAPVGWLVDRFKDRRVHPLRYSAISGFAAVASGSLLLLTDELMFVAPMALFLGVFQELSGSAWRSIFTDSLAKGGRAPAFVKNWILRLVGSASATLLAALVMQLPHDEIWCLKLSLWCGLSLMVPVSMAILRMADPEPSELPKLQEDPNESKRPWGPRFSGVVPCLCVTFFLTSTATAGLTAQFFVLFFTNEVQLSMTSIYLLEAAASLAGALCSQASERVAKHAGRSLTMFCAVVLSTGCTFLLTADLPPELLSAFFLLRRGLGNCFKPLLDAIIADFTPSAHRGKWNAVLSLSMVGWSGTALLGGYLADLCGYRYVIFVSSLMFSGAACLFLGPLVWLVPRSLDIKQALASN